MGLVSSGAAIKVLKNKLDAYNIPHHFIYKRNVGVRLPLAEILQANTPYTANILKRRLIEEGLKEDKCEICKISYWNGQKLTLQLHHINGDHNDNRLENLQILCPNCHSLTENYGNKLNKEVKTCPDCGRPIYRYSTYCRVCGPKHTNQPNRKVAIEDKPSKEQLLEMLTNTSFKDIGRNYGISDNAVRKWCKQYGIPHTKKELKSYLVENK